MISCPNSFSGQDFLVTLNSSENGHLCLTLGLSMGSFCSLTLHMLLSMDSHTWLLWDCNIFCFVVLTIPCWILANAFFWIDWDELSGLHGVSAEHCFLLTFSFVELPLHFAGNWSHTSHFLFFHCSPVYFFSSFPFIPFLLLFFRLIFSF